MIKVVQYTPEQLHAITIAEVPITAKTIASGTAASVWSIGINTILSTAISFFTALVNIYEKKMVTS